MVSRSSWKSCSYPVTGRRVVSRVYTDLAIIDIGADGFELLTTAPGVDIDYIRERTGADLL